jgi:uncharacterized protein DUF6695
LVLIDNKNQKCHYFDFGRYHSPFQYGRVRSSDTDHELEINTIPLISENGTTIINYYEILRELQLNPACHGEGEIHASYCTINFQDAFNNANEMQHASPIPYGPFRYKGSNCSRFVNKTILAGNPSIRHKIKLNFFVPLTPTPINNVNSLKHKIILPKRLKGIGFIPLHKLEYSLLKSTLPQPLRNNKVPDNAQWLSGEGVGSWFDFNYRDGLLEVIRYAPTGEVECSGFYKSRSSEYFISIKKLNIDYPSNCKVVTLRNEDTKLMFDWTSN